MFKKASNKAILQSIASAYGAGQKTVEQAIDDALEASMHHIGCARISLWRFENDGGARGLRCFVAKLVGQPTTDDSTLLAEDQYRAYYAALVQRSAFVSDDAMRDPQLLAMRGGYLLQNGITALLDIPVTINGRAYGIVCCEQIGTAYHWSPQQIRTARETVTRAGLLLAQESTIRLGTLESMPIEPF